MRLLVGRRNRKYRRCRNKPRSEDKSSKSNGRERWDDGASRAYKRLGRAGFERYAKTLAPLWWNVPPYVQRSGLFIDTSKHKIRSGPVDAEDDKLLVQELPSPQYTLKVLKTAYKIYRYRLQKRYLIESDRTADFWSEEKSEEEHKWAYIIERPLLEQYVLMLQYIRRLADKLAWKMGHDEVFCSETPMRIMQTLHPLKRLEFRDAKHYLPKPLITSSFSDIQYKINQEVKRLDRALEKEKLEKEKDITTLPPGIVPAVEFPESSSSEFSDFEYSKRSSIKNRLLPDKYREETREDKGGSYMTKLMEREGHVYTTYRDSGSDESLFMDFADFGDEKNIINSSIPHSSNNIKEKKSTRKKKKKEKNISTKVAGGENFPNPEFPNIMMNLNENQAEGITPVTPYENLQLPNISNRDSVNFIYDRSEGGWKSNTPQNDSDEANMNDDTDHVPNSTKIYETGQNTSNQDMGTLLRYAHGDFHIHNIQSRVKDSVNQIIVNPMENQEENTGSYGDTLTKNAGGDAGVLNRTEILAVPLLQSSMKVKSLIDNISRFFIRSNCLLDNLEGYVDRLERTLSNRDLSDWRKVRRHLKIILNKKHNNNN